MSLPSESWPLTSRFFLRLSILVPTNAGKTALAAILSRVLKRAERRRIKAQASARDSKMRRLHPTGELGRRAPLHLPESLSKSTHTWQTLAHTSWQNTGNNP